MEKLKKYGITFLIAILFFLVFGTLAGFFVVGKNLIITFFGG